MDENGVINIAVTDDGTINEMAALLQFLGFTGEEAAQRLASGFQSASTSQTRLEAATTLNSVAAKAQYDILNSMSNVVSRLTTTEAARVQTLDAQQRLTALLTISQREGQEVALQFVQATTQELTARAGLTEAMAAQGAQTEGLSRLQQNLAARTAEVDSAYRLATLACNTYTIEQRNAQTANVEAAVSARAYAESAAGIAEALSVAQARAASFAASQISLTEATTGFNIAERETAALLKAFGVNAAEAATRVSGGFAEANTVIGLTSGQFAILSEAASQGYKNIDELYQAFALLSRAELEALSTTGQLGAALNTLNTAAETAQSVFASEAVAIARDSGTTRDAVAAKEALSAASARLADITEADAAAARDVVAAMGGYAGIVGTITAELNVFVTAEERAAAASLKFSEDLVAVRAAGQNILSTFGGMNAIFASAFTGAELIKASDTFTRITASLQTVTSSAGELNDVFGKIKTTANATQTSLDQNAKLFVQLKDSAAGAKISNDGLIQAIGGLDTALKLGNVSGQDAYRVMRSLSEILSTTSGSAERFAQNLRRESPAAFAQLEGAAKRLGISLDDVFGKTDEYGAKNDALRTKLTQLQAEQNGVGGSVSSYASKLRSANNEVNNSQASIDKLTKGHYSNAAAVENAKNKISALNDKIIDGYDKQGKYNSLLSQAKDRQDDKVQSEIKATQAQIAQNEANQNATDRGAKLIAVLQEVYRTNGEAAKQFTTVSGTLTVLSNNLIDFAGSSNTANIGMTALKDVILVLANNLDIVVPGVVAFGAAIAVVKVAQLVKDVYDLGNSLRKLALNPFNLEVIAVASGLFLAAYGFSKLIEAATFGKVVILDMHKALEGAKGIAGLLGATFNDLTKSLTDTAIHTQATRDATLALADAHKVSSTAANDNFVRFSVLDGQQSKYASTVSGATNAVGQNTEAVYKSANAVQQEADQLRASNAAKAQAIEDYRQYYDRVTAAKAAQDDMNKSVAASPSLWASLTSAIGNVISKLYDYIAAAAKAAASAVGGLFGGGSSTSAAPAPAGKAREGGSFTVAGTGPVDSKLIAVSPGEVVTVQTPAQFKAGVAPAARAGQTHFAAGGVTTGAGVDLGLGVPLSPSAGLSSVTGYEAPSTIDQSQLTAAVNDNATVTTANTTAIDANTAALNATPSASTTSIGSTSDTIDASNTKSGVYTADQYQDDAVAGVRNPDGTITGKSGTTYIPQYQNQYASGLFGGKRLSGYVTDKGVQVPVSGGGTALTNDATSVLTASQTASSSTSTSKSSDDITGTQNNAKAIASGEIPDYSVENLSSQLYPGGTPQRGKSLSSIQESFAGVQHFRDGGDFYVPGGTGVDSRIMQLAVSPGESVHVRTPSQQRGNDNGGNVNQTVIMNVTASDADSFKQSDAQLLQGISRGLKRAGRR